MYLSRIQLAHELLKQTQLGHVLRRDGYGMHQLLWDLFPDGKYLFREENSREQLGSSRNCPLFYALSAQAPAKESPLFRIDSKLFRPQLKKGTQLAFRLRANPTIARRQEDKKNLVRHDVIMDAKLQHVLRNCLEYGILQEDQIYSTDQGGRRVMRTQLSRNLLQQQLFASPDFKMSRHDFMQQQLQAAEQASRRWLEKKGELSGFMLETDIQTSRYLSHSLSHAKKKRNAAYSSMDYQGVLRVVDADTFIEQIARGFGSAKRFGCGLMLIRRA